MKYDSTVLTHVLFEVDKTLQHRHLELIDKSILRYELHPQNAILINVDWLGFAR